MGLDGGSADTTTGTMAGFVLNMILHPNIQEKAQAEIDRVVGSERLPTLSE
jgi:cytochrome P450